MWLGRVEGGRSGRDALKRCEKLECLRMFLDELDERCSLGVGFRFTLIPVLPRAHIDAQTARHDSL